MLKRDAFCVHIVRPCFVFSLSSSNSFLFLSYSDSFFSVMFGLEPDISLTDSPVKPGNDEKEKKLRNDEREKKREMTKEKKSGE